MYIHIYKSSLMEKDWLVAAFGGDMPLLTEVKQWCKETYGVPGLRWKDYVHFGEIAFSDEKDLTLFLLRWQ